MKNNNEKDDIKLMQENFDILNDYPDAHYFVGVDLNARTKYFFDYLPDDNLDHIFGETSYQDDTFEHNRKK